MSEMDLDAAIEMFQVAETYKEYEVGLLAILMRVHTREELKDAKKIIDDKKSCLMKNSPEFNAIMEHHKSEAEQHAKSVEFAVHVQR